MRFSTIFAAALSVGVVYAETINVMVGANSTLTFTPSEVTAQDGDVIAFTFLTKNHTVTQSSFAAPCTNLSTDSVDSGFQFVAAGATTFPQFSFNVTNTSAPLWFYCRQTGHCGMGMVFAVNPTVNKTFAEFQSAAMATANSTTNSTTTTNSTGTSGSSPSSTSGAPGASGSAGVSPSSSGSGSSPSATNNGAMSVKTGGALLLSGVGLVAGLLL